MKNYSNSERERNKSKRKIITVCLSLLSINLKVGNTLSSNYLELVWIDITTKLYNYFMRGSLSNCKLKIIYFRKLKTYQSRFFLWPIICHLSLFINFQLTWKSSQFKKFKERRNVYNILDNLILILIIKLKMYINLISHCVELYVVTFFLFSGLKVHNEFSMLKIHKVYLKKSI